MEPQVRRDRVTMDPPEPAERVYVAEQSPDADPPVAVERTVAAPHRDVERVESFSAVAPHSVLAGLLAVLMLLWGGVAMARAGFGDDMREPTVEVFGLSGNAISGAIVAGLGLLLLIAAVSRDRGPVVFLATVIGIASLIFAIEPDAGDEALAIETELPLLIAIGCAVVVLAALALPTITRRSERIGRT